MPLRRARVGILGIDRDFDTPIGLHPHVSCRRHWIDRLVLAGALPVIIPPRIDSPQEYLELVDAIVLPGGGDIDPRLYGAKAHPETVSLDPDRDRWEVEVVRAALATDQPVLSICRGMQILNVALGGTLYQHLPDESHVQLDHYRSGDWDQPVHEVRIDVSSHVGRALSSAPGSSGNSHGATIRLQVNSIHHQGLAVLGKDLVVTARSGDGVIEAIELPSHRFVVGVQWHPELMADDTQAIALFSRLVESTWHGGRATIYPSSSIR